MKYTEKDLYKGMKLRCVSTIEPHWWNVGKQYEVEKRTDGLFILKDETGYIWNRWLILDFLNGKSHCKMEVVEEEKEMTKYVEITKLIDWSRDPELLEVGKVYKVVAEYKESMYINSVSIYINENESCYYLRSDQFKYVEQNEEEKEMKKYAKITKYAGLIDTEKENGLEIGKEYEIVKFSSFSEDCWVYLNDKRPEYFISETQYELVEKEGPVALIEVDTLKLIEAKIEQLRDEQENLRNKRMRIKHQEEALRDKRMKLVESKKAFEFLKQQKFL